MHPIFTDLLKKNKPAIPFTLLKRYITQHHLNAIYQQLKPQMGGFIEASSVSISVLSCEQNKVTFAVKLGVFFEEHIGGCNCLDDPHIENGYCEITVYLKENSISLMKT